MIALSQTYFNERYNYSLPASLDFCKGIFIGGDYYIIPGAHTYLDNLNFNFISLMKLDSIGYPILVKNYGDTIHSYSINNTQGAFKEVSNGSFYSVGTKREYTNDWVHDVGLIYKFNSDLDTLWTKSIGDIQTPYDTNYLFHHFDLLQNNELVIIGEIVVEGTQGIAFLIKTDSLGNELWRQYYPLVPHSKGINVVQTPDGGFALSCFNWSFQGINSSNFLIKTDSLGNEQWRREIGGPYSDDPLFIVNSPDNTIMGAYTHSDSVALPSSDSFNRDAVIKYDLDGNLIWEKIHGESLLNKWVKSANINEDGKLILSGIKYKDGGDYHYYRIGYLLNCNNNGDSLWYREYELLKEYPSGNYLEGVSPTNDGGYIAVGDVLPWPPDTGNQDVWVIKVDSLGCESWDICWVGEKEHIALREAEQLKIFPNPANYELNIFVPKENENEKHYLLIYDLYGRKVEETVIPPGTTTMQLSVSGWSSGLYTAIASHNGKISGRGKFVVR